MRSTNCELLTEKHFVRWFKAQALWFAAEIKANHIGDVSVPLYETYVRLYENWFMQVLLPYILVLCIGGKFDFICEESVTVNEIKRYTFI